MNVPALERVRGALGAAALLFPLSACVHSYQMPERSEPHALVAWERRVTAPPETSVRVDLSVDGESLQLTNEGVTRRPRTDVFRVAPGLSELEANSVIYRRELRTYWDGYSGSRYWSGGHCGLRGCVPGYPVDPYPMLVTRIVDVPVSRCERKFQLYSTKGASYRLRLKHDWHGHCTLECAELQGKKERPCVRVVEQLVE